MICLLGWGVAVPLLATGNFPIYMLKIHIMFYWNSLLVWLLHENLYSFLCFKCQVIVILSILICYVNK